MFYVNVIDDLNFLVSQTLIYLMNISQKILLSIVIILLTSLVRGEVRFTGTPFVKNYPRSVYMAGSQTWDIKQGSNGMMYFANNNGLLEYDGANWNVYPLPNLSVVRSLGNSDEGVLYAGGYNEMGYYKIGSGGGANYTSLLDLVPEEHVNFGDVWKIYNYQDGIIFQTYSQLMLYSEGKIDIIKAPSVFHFSFMINNEYYVNDMEKGLMRYAMGELYQMKGMETLIGKEIWGILPFNNKLLIATASDGIFLYNGNSLSSINNNTSSFLKENQVYSTLLLENKQIVFGTIQNGILICDKDGNSSNHLNMTDGLQNNTILCVGLDYLGNMWLGTDHGIDYLEVNSPLSKISFNYGVSSGYSAIIKDDRIYLGTNQGLYTKKINDVGSVIENEKILYSIDDLKGQVWSLDEIDGTLFCGHHNGTYIVDDITARKISDIPGAWMFLQIPGFPDKIICGTYTGLVVYEKKKGDWVYGKQLTGFAESARTIEFADDGSLWMTHGYQGVYHLFFNNNYDSIIRVEFYNNLNSNLPDHVTGLVKIENKILFLTPISILEFRENLDDFFKNEKYGNLFGNKSVQTIEKDQEGNLWYFADENVGVLRHGEDGNYVDISMPFRELQGSFIYSFELVYPYDENNVYFGVENGFVHYNPKYNKDYSYDFKTYLTGMKTEESDFIYNSSKSQDKNIILDFDDNSAEFLFAANDFTNPEKISYSTFLEGNDEHWSSWQKRNIRSYTNLYEGKYTFRVKSRNIYGTISNEQSMSFRVKPPFIRSIYAYVIYMILFIVLIFLFASAIKRRFIRLKQRDEKKQQELFRKKEEQLRLEGLESEKELIWMRNEKLREDVKNKDKELANSTMQMLQKNKMLITLRDELKRLAGLPGTDSRNYDIDRLVRGINKEIDNEKQWHVFETHFESVHEEFLKRIKSAYTDLTPRELKLCAYLRMNISSKEISVLMNISTRGVEISRYRLRKKLGILRHTNLTDFILSF